MTDSVISPQWLTVPLEDVILRIVGGGTPSKSKPEYYQGKIPWMSVKDMNKHVLHDTVDHISQAAVDNSSTNVIPSGTPIIATRMSLGKIVIADFDSAINQDLKALFLPAEIHRDYLVYWYRSVARKIEQMGTGTTVKGVRLEALKGLEFALPPLAEQKVIADKLDTLLAQVENTKARLERIPQILKRFRQSVLAAAVSGRLTEEWRTTEKAIVSGHELHKQIKDAHAAEGGHARGNASKPTVEAHDLSKDDLPECWDVAEMRDICVPGKPITYGILKPGPELDEGVPYIRVADFPGNKLNMANIKKTSVEIDQKFKRARLSKGDLLLSIRGSVGRLIKIPASLEGANITQDTARLSISPLVSTDFVYWVLLAESTQRRMKNATRGVAVRGINIGDVRALQVPLPPLAEQTEIVRRVDQLFAHADRIEQQVNNALARVNNLTQSILAKAFRGELTEQWRKDNPELITGENSAEALLERIKAERAAAKPAKKIRKKMSS